MSATPAVPLLVLGLLTLFGVGLTTLASPLLGTAAVPPCCRREVEAFLVRAPLIGLAAAVSAAGGLALLLS